MICTCVYICIYIYICIHIYIRKKCCLYLCNLFSCFKSHSIPTSFKPHFKAKKVLPIRLIPLLPLPWLTRKLETMNYRQRLDFPRFMSLQKMRYSQIIICSWVSSKNRGVFSPNHPLKNRVFHDFHHPFWGVFPLFLETPIISGIKSSTQIGVYIYIYRAICKDSLLKVGWVFPQCKEMGVSKPLTSILLAACKTIDIFKPATWARQCVKG